MASCENCAKGFVLPGTPAGSMVDGAYYSPAPGIDKETAPAPSSKAIVLLTDIFGLPLVNSKLLADELATKVGVDVWVPDLFNGAPPIKPHELTPLMPDRAGVQIPFMNKLRLAALIIPRIPSFYTNRAKVVDARVADFINKLKTEKKYEKFGAVGYCFGGSIAVRIASRNIVDTVVICHPGPASVEEIKAMSVPSSWALAEEDSAFPPKLRKSAEEVFKAREGKEDFIEYEFKDWKGTAHGFAARPNLEVPEVKAGFEGALEQTVNWFKKTL
ncbi:dienelactone hydrolase endo-1-3,1,4-beta-D-glucanase [Dentipellis sp. KUC8613]|nr:dienelactone hydrolase endo-1-3,1,4-beta-D-glucanase [Dentipellis sp. KUC8613]